MAKKKSKNTWLWWLLGGAVVIYLMTRKSATAQPILPAEVAPQGGEFAGALRGAQQLGWGGFLTKPASMADRSIIDAHPALGELDKFLRVFGISLQFMGPNDFASFDTPGGNLATPEERAYRSAGVLYPVNMGLFVTNPANAMTSGRILPIGEDGPLHYANVDNGPVHWFIFDKTSGVRIEIPLEQMGLWSSPNHYWRIAVVGLPGKSGPGRDPSLGEQMANKLADGATDLAEDLLGKAIDSGTDSFGNAVESGVSDLASKFGF